MNTSMFRRFVLVFLVVVGLGLFGHVQNVNAQDVSGCVLQSANVECSSLADFPHECQANDNTLYCCETSTQQCKVTPPPPDTDPDPPGDQSSATGNLNPWYKQTFPEWLTKVSDPNNPQEIFGERYTAAQVQWVVYGLIYMVMNVTDDGPTFACVMNYPDGLEMIDNCGALMTESINKLRCGFNPTATGCPTVTASNTLNPRSISATAYFQDVGSRLSLVSDANAQGFGFTAASPVLNLWRASRNMAYTLMVLVVIIMAFMIMFRVKLSPQTVITVQSALPKVVITLILITFSYAIGGLVIDLTYVIIGLVAALIHGSDMTTNMTWSQIFNNLTQVSAFSHLVYYFIGSVLSFIINFISMTAALLVVASPGIALAGGVIGPLLLIGLIIFLLFFLWKGIKIILMLIKAYMNIILNIAFAPFLLLGGALGVGGFGKWIKGLFASALVFPVTGIMFFVSYVFLEASYPQSWPQAVTNVVVPFNINQQVDVNTSWDPPLTFGTQDSASRMLYLMVSFSIIMLIPKAADIIKATMAGREFGYGSAITGEARDHGPVPAGLQSLAGSQFAIRNLSGLQPGLERASSVLNRVIGRRA